MLAVIAAGIQGLLSSDIAFPSFVLGLFTTILLFLVVLMAWRTLCCWRLRYHLTRDSLTIHWGYRKTVVPLSEVRDVISSEGKPISWAGGIHWYAYHVAQAQVTKLGPVQFYATHLSPKNLVYVLTRRGHYGISLDNPGRFLRSLETCRGLGALSTEQFRIEESPLVQLPLWRDPWVLTMFSVALLVNVALFAFLSQRFPSAASLLSLHFAPSGQVDRIGDKLEIFKLPVMAMAVLGANGLVGLLLHLKERYLAVLTLAVALMVGILFWVAAAQIIR